MENIRRPLKNVVVQVGGILLKRLGSKKLALVLIVVIAVFMAVAMVIQRPGALFASIWFLALIAVFGLNLVACTWLQVQKAWRHHVKSRQALENRRSRSGLFLRVRGWSLGIFHVGLVLIVLGALINFGTTLEGYKYLGPGQVYTEEHGGYNQLVEGPLFLEQHRRFQVRLDRVEMDFPTGDTPYLKQAVLSFFQDSRLATTGEVTFTKAFYYSGYQFFLDERGFSALIRVGRDDSPGSDSYLSFETKRLHKKEEYRNTFGLGPYQVMARFYPTPPDEAGEIKDYKPVQPEIHFDVKEGSKTVFRGVLAKGKKVVLPDGTGIELVDVDFWVALKITRNLGVPLVFAGFGLSTLFILLYYGFLPVGRRDAGPAGG